MNNILRLIEGDISDINIHCCLNMKKPIMHRIFFKRMAHNEEYIINFCTDRFNAFHSVCLNWYLYNISQSKNRFTI